ncbi:hypothetical protein N7447_002233 [Penicillium robsamsonii]|uniref:uncharacterized protein n=1 Tax=Penicillium robsamsonii TaxID=1792511 RepID=UPI0025480F3F|nr:uncharacterized protein N7447_002233 [Penicillium robsamsonii]KAJ5836207.1 hypothetical protein N7447_002233 [Penicillium robsamsonii]
MASLLSTPTETLRIIFTSLSHNDLAATWSDSQHPPIAQFLRSIVQRPELATYVHDVVLHGDSFDQGVDDPGNESPKIPVTEPVVNELVEFITRINVPYADKWTQKLRAGSMDAFATLLISQLHNLKRLYLDKNYNRETHLRGMMLRSALCEEPKNSHLSSFAYLKDMPADSACLYYDIREKTDTRNTQDILPLFYLPSVTRLGLWSITLLLSHGPERIHQIHGDSRHLTRLCYVRDILAKSYRLHLGFRS